MTDELMLKICTIKFFSGLLYFVVKCSVEVAPVLWLPYTCVVSASSPISVLVLMYLFWTVLFSGQPKLKNALLEEEDLSPDCNQSLLLQTEDQNFDSPFVHLEPPLDVDDYMFGLTDCEGISDLFDAYDITLTV